MISKQRSKRIASYVSAPHRLEHCTRCRTRIHVRHHQPGEWPPARVVHLRSACYGGILVAATLVGQAASRLATTDPFPALLLVTLALGSGIWWAAGGVLAFAGFNLLNWHIVVGLALTAVIVIHMFARAKRLRKRDITGRRRVLHFITDHCSSHHHPALLPDRPLVPQDSFC